MKTIGLISNKKSKKIFLLPKAVAELAKAGVKVNVAINYGKAFNIADAEYVNAGATIMSINDVIANSDVICNADPFNKKQLKRMSGKVAITMANYLANVDMLFHMLKQNITGLAWNNLADEKDYVFYPEIEKIKGVEAVKVIAEGMKKGLSKPKEKVVYPNPAKMTILNATFAGVSAAKFALANGFDVMILDHDKDYLKQLSNDQEIKSICAKAKTSFFTGDATFENLEKRIKIANCFINTSISPEERTRTRVTKEMANSMPAGSILVDVGSENGYGFAWIKKIVKPDLTYVRYNKNFYVTIQDSRDLMAKEFTDIVSAKSVKPLIAFANEGQSNKYIAKTVICNKGKVVDNYVKTQLTLY